VHENYGFCWISEILTPHPQTDLRLSVPPFHSVGINGPHDRHLYQQPVVIVVLRQNRPTRMPALLTHQRPAGVRGAGIHAGIHAGALLPRAASAGEFEGYRH